VVGEKFLLKQPFMRYAALGKMGSLPTFAALSNEISFKPEASGGTADEVRFRCNCTNVCNRFTASHQPKARTK
jgi:hypothetical protein